MRIIGIILLLFALSSCSQEIEIESVVSEIASPEIVDSLADKIVEETAIDSVALERDSTREALGLDIIRFMDLLRVDDFSQAQKMLHPDGLYYYTVGRIPPKRLNLKGLKRHTGLLEGAYSYGLPDEYEESDSTVSGLYWLDALQNDFTENSPKWKYGYSPVGYGFTGNYSSDRIRWDDDWPYTPDSIDVHVAYIDHNDPEIGGNEILMIEFFQDKQGDWKIYAIGNLEWTP